MGSRKLLVLCVCVVSFGLVAVAAAQESAETLREQQAAIDAERGLKVPATPSPGTGNPAGIDGSQAHLFIAVDDTTVFTYVVNVGTNDFTQLFDGTDPWGAGLIPGVNPGDAVVYFVSGTELWRWQSGVPELCCNLTYQGANQAMVSAAYNSNTGRLLMTKNTTTEAVYSLAVEAGQCPANCEMTQDIVYASADNDFGGLAYDPVGDIIYGTNDDSSPGPAGVYEINGDGSTTLVVAYPAGETDIDGLAYGDGKLYLVTDEPGDIYVYDVAGAAFDPPLANPWTTSETFSAGAYGTGLIPVELQSLTVD